MAISRDAEIVALCVFGFGTSTKLTFQRPHVIHPRMRAGLDDLVAAGMLTVSEDRGAKTWQRTDAMGSPAKLYRPPEKGESFTFTIDERAAPPAAEGASS